MGDLICFWNAYAFQTKRSSMAQKLFSGRAFTCNRNLLPSIWKAIKRCHFMLKNILTAIHFFSLKRRNH